ncbi:HAD hydrolase family protein, partial [Clostridium sp. SL.3.18]|nr:HAD hydrolase family protein [Clostridium sp. SL.3.18]
MKIKARMIGLDLDGTLLTTEKEFTPYTKEILRKAIAQGPPGSRKNYDSLGNCFS